MSTAALKTSTTFFSKDPKIADYVFCIKNLKNLTQEVNRFRTFEENWDTYKSKAVKSKACDMLVSFLDTAVWFKPMVKFHVYPTSAGDMGVEWDIEGKDFAVIFSGSEATLITDDSEGEEKEETYSNMFELLAKLQMSGIFTV